MPRRLVRASVHDRDWSLGWLALAWLEFFAVHGPGDVQGEPVIHGLEQSGFIVDCYGLRKPSGKLLYDSAFYSRPKGADKSGLGARLALFEALGPCRFAGKAKGGEVYRDPWGLGFEYPYVAGEPMGRPVHVPYVRIMATEEGQTGNVYDAVHFNLTDGPLTDVPGLDCGLTRTYLPGGGEITPSTASSSSKDGGKETFVVFDESHIYNTPELRRMYDTVVRNTRKRKAIAGTWYLETTTMFAPGEESSAEATFKLADLIDEGQQAGTPKVKRERLLADHRWGECEDLTDEAALRAAIEDAFGDAMDWNDLDGIVDQFHDTRVDPSDSRRYFLNALTQATNAWVAEFEWASCRDGTNLVRRGEPVTLGFDGSRKRSRGVTDATALIGCRVADGHVFQIGVWEQPDGALGIGWEVPRSAVNATIADAFKNFTVVGFYADPALWETDVAQWEATYGRRLHQKVRSTAAHPIQFWMTGGRAAKASQAITELHTAIVDGEMTHDGAGALTRHVLNARHRHGRYGMAISKENPDSPKKIDAAVAAALAWKCRLDALAAGIGRQSGSVRRIR